MLLMRSASHWAPRPMASLIRVSLAALLLCGALTGAAQARVWVGLGIGIPLFLPPLVFGPPAYYPPYYYGPPVGYPPPGNTFSYSPPGSQPQSLAPSAGYGPQGGYAPPPGYPSQGYPSRDYTQSGGYTPWGSGRGESVQTCHAGAYVCPLVQDTPPGGACSCPGHGGQMVRGQAD